MFSDVLHEVSLIIKTWWQSQKELGQVFWSWCMPTNIFHPLRETFPVCSSKSDHLSFVPQLGQVHGSIIVINHKITIIAMISIYLVYGHWRSYMNNWQAVYWWGRFRGEWVGEVVVKGLLFLPLQGAISESAIRGKFDTQLRGLIMRCEKIILIFSTGPVT